MESFPYANMKQNLRDKRVRCFFFYSMIARTKETCYLNILFIPPVHQECNSSPILKCVLSRFIVL